MNEYDKMMKEHPWRMRWEGFKLWLSFTLIWSWHPRRNRWCDRCGDFIGNSKADAKAHICAKVRT